MSEKQSLVQVGKDELVGWFDNILRPCLAELVGVALFVFIGTMAVNVQNNLAIALAHGLAIVVLVMSTANIRWVITYIVI